MSRSPMVCLAFAACVTPALSGCAGLPGNSSWVSVRPVQTETALVDPLDSLYGSAKAAIERRDYGRALELLQAARSRGGEDGRILNALAVVYDKLGRFDLSARYYKQALELEPDSQVVAHNMAYSASLRANSITALPATAVPPQVELAEPSVPRLVQVAGNVLRLELPVSPPGSEQPAQILVVNDIAPDTAGELRKPELASAVTTAVKPSVYDDPPQPRPAALNLDSRSPAVIPQDITLTVSPAVPTEVALAGPAVSPVRQIAATPALAAAQVVEKAERPGPRQIAVSPNAPRVELPVQTAAVTMLLPTMSGLPVMVVNATGQEGAGDPVRRHLESRGWTAPRAASVEGLRQAATTIYYSAAEKRIANGLAHTLTVPVRLVLCAQPCRGVQLLLGEDSISMTSRLTAQAFRRETRIAAK